MSGIKQIGCLHAHHGNIGYLDDALKPFAAEPAHFVDPALVRRIGVDPTFSAAQARQRVGEELAWMAGSGMDGIVITCTAYAASLPESLPVSIPVLTIDEPFLGAISERQGPIGLVFTNPGTVAGTLRRLNEFAAARGFQPDVNVETIEGAFDLFMAGRQAEHDGLVGERLTEIVRRGEYATVAVGQLSLSRAAKAVDPAIVNLLDALQASVGPRLGLEPAEA